MMEIGLLIVFIAFSAVATSIDPCVHNEIIDDISRNTGYLLQQQEYPRCEQIQPKWYRYMNSDGGVMATSCPTGPQCGTRSQVWMNDTIPGVGCEEMVEVCIRHDDNCCDRKATIRAKNCGFFLVYQLIPIPPCSRYCFANTTLSSRKGLSTSPNCLPTSPTFTSKGTTRTITSKPTTKSTNSIMRSSTTSVTITKFSSTSPPTSDFASASVISSTETSTSKSTPSTVISLTKTSTSKSTPRTVIPSTKTSTSKSTSRTVTPSTRTSTSKSTPSTVISLTKTSTSKSTPRTVIPSTRTSTSNSTNSTVISSTRMTTMKITSSTVIISTKKPSMNYSYTTVISSTVSSSFATKNASSAKGSMDTAVIVGSSIGGIIVGSLLLTGVIAAIIRINRRRENERKRKAYETIVMNRNAVENQCYSYERNWKRDSRSTTTFSSRLH